MANTRLVAPAEAVGPTLLAGPGWFDPVVEPLRGSPGWVVAALELHREFQSVASVIRGHGAGNEKTAVAAAIGELAERFVATDPRVAQALVHANPVDGRLLPDERAHPARLPMRPGWVLGTAVSTGEPVWVPAGAVLLGWQTDPAFVDATGLAAGATWEAAVAGAINEVRERDAIGRWWRGLLTCQPAPVPGDIDEALAHEDLGARVTRVVSTAGERAVVAAIHRGGHDLTVGSTWGPDVSHAVAEALMVRATIIEHLRTDLTPSGLSDGLGRLKWGWQHPQAVLDRFDSHPRRSSEHEAAAEPIAVTLGWLDPTPLGPLVVVRVLIPGSYRLESTQRVWHPDRAIPLESIGAPHPFG